MLSSGMTPSPFYLFIENFIHSVYLSNYYFSAKTKNPASVKEFPEVAEYLQS
jgi:hypothetical protein